jgi:hypothetical protein
MGPRNGSGPFGTSTPGSFYRHRIQHTSGRYSHLGCKGHVRCRKLLRLTVRPPLPISLPLICHAISPRLASTCRLMKVGLASIHSELQPKSDMFYPIQIDSRAIIKWPIVCTHTSVIESQPDIAIQNPGNTDLRDLVYRLITFVGAVWFGSQYFFPAVQGWTFKKTSQIFNLHVNRKSIAFSISDTLTGEKTHMDTVLAIYCMIGPYESMPLLMRKVPIIVIYYYNYEYYAIHCCDYDRRQQS